MPIDPTAVRVEIISTFWGDPGPWTRLIHDTGALHLHTVGSVDEAVAAVRAGVDVIVAQGAEAGGHVRGTVSTLALVPAVVDAVGAVGSVPVVAAGGIADGRGLAAVLALGAQGAWIGTRFLLADEANVHTEYRERLMAADAHDTAYTEAFSDGWADAPHRVLRNATLTAWEGAGRPRAPDRPGEGEVIARTPNGSAITRYHMGLAQAATEGRVREMALYAGQGVGLARVCEPAADIVHGLCTEARRLLG